MDAFRYDYHAIHIHRPEIDLLLAATGTTFGERIIC